MQKDFHFYVLYILARSVGFGPGEAGVVAYASQFTDDAVEGDSLRFENGGFFQPVVTAHNYHSLRGAFESPTREAGYRVWIPFHFMPGGDESSGKSEDPFYRRLEVRPARLGDGSPMDRVLGRILEAGGRSYGLHLLGIALHVLADTWSHQGFIGLTRPENEVDDLEVEGEGRGFWEFLKEEFHDLAPKTGHAEALTIPDEPYRRWSYRDFRGDRHEIDNVERCLSAARECYRVLSVWLEKYPGWRRWVGRPLEEIESLFGELFEASGDLEERCRRWRKALREGRFFDPEPGEEPVYRRGAWFRQAVEVEFDEETGLRYRWRRNFNRSHWRLFHAAAAYHRFVVLNEILPGVGVVCG
ncbi:DUF6765 family protein [Thermosulfurimonas sp. F29]|uniref:DUF6765 family protein n=1 Tax=Thermosulfurimonas sp. F29 TaxID=2867247 RepID=UPI001C828CC7|nr:DUF6765 family protein [Thermosulfurimonas sp. F29]MBX6423144.1 hypothetical protein [Thermosulfurimonas sp. F29]